MPFFGKKEIKPNASQKISQLRQQGMDDDSVIMTLQSQGYNPDEISDALSMDVQMPPMQPQYRQPQMQQQPQYNYQQQQPQQEMPEDKMEEIAEAIIDEKWTNLVKDINKIVEWKDKVEGRLTAIEQEIKDVKERFESLHQGIIGKISEYDTNIKDVGVEIKAMEKVFQKVLPAFTENVNKMERILKSRP